MNDRKTYAAIARSELRTIVERIEHGRGTAWPLRSPAAEADRRRLASNDEVYLLLSHVLDAHAELVRQQRAHGNGTTKGPYIIGITGSVAVGKSTTSEILRDILSRYPRRREVELVTTDSFLYPNHVLESHGQMDRKGFPESFDVARLLSFLSNLRQGLSAEQEIPIYSHSDKDIVAGQFRAIRNTEILILEGVNILSDQFYYFGNVFSVQDFLDCTIYLDAEPNIIKGWFEARFTGMRDEARRHPTRYFQKLIDMDDPQFHDYVLNIWYSVNMKLLNESILPKRDTVDVILTKDENHFIQGVQLSREFHDIFDHHGA